MNYHPSALRKYISEHNRRIRKDIGEEIKSQKVKYNQFLKVKREELKKEQTINTKGLTKEGLVNAILKSPVIMRAIKSDKERKKPFFDGFEFKNDSLQPIKKQAKQTEKKIEPKEFHSPYSLNIVGWDLSLSKINITLAGNIPISGLGRGEF